MIQKPIQLITGILLVLVTGLFWGTWFSLSRTMYELSPEIFITIGKPSKLYGVNFALIMSRNILINIIVLTMGMVEDIGVQI